jgi:endoglucanase
VPLDDAYTSESNATGLHTTGSLAVNAGAGNRRYTWLKFDASSIPSGATNVQATLKLYAQTSVTGTFSVYRGSAFEEETLTWANQPALGTLVTSRSGVTSGVYNDFDVSSYVNAGGVYSMVITSSNTKQVNFNSKESSTNKPQLVLTWTNPSPSPSPTVTTTSPTPDPTVTTVPPTTTPPTTVPPTTTPPAGVFGVKVSGNKLVSTLDGSVVQLRGVNRSGTEYACTEGWGIFDGPSTDASITTMRNWGATHSVTGVRVSLEEDCWLSTATTGYKGLPYRNAIKDYIDRLTKAGLYVVVDEHGHCVSDCTVNNHDMDPMPKRAKAPLFWGGDPANNIPGFAETIQGITYPKAVIFDMFNEPYPDSNSNTVNAWNCLINGGTCPGVSYTAAGMSELVAAVRADATNVIMVGGPQYAGVLDGPSDVGNDWLARVKPLDPTGQIAASIHIYYENPSSPEWSPCYATSCWNSQIAPVAAVSPVVMGEIGEHDCTFSLIDGSYDGAGGNESLVGWADARDISYLAWSWIASSSSCASGPTLISNYDGTANVSYGTGYRAHLMSRATP